MNDNIQSRVQRVLDELVDSGNDRGLQVAVYHDGKLVVDAWAGDMDDHSGTKVNGDTLFPVFSVGKGIASTTIHRLVEQGLLEYDQPISAYWPEFEAAGKQALTLRHVLTHTAGMWAIPEGMTAHDLCQWDDVCTRLAAQAPATTPGQATRYHALTMAWLLGEPARRVTGLDFDQIIQQAISKPLGIDNDMFFGIDDQQAHRVATLEHALPFDRPQEEDKAIPHTVQPLESMMNDPVMRRACMPAANGIMTAKAIAKHYAALLPDGVDCVTLLKPLTLAQACVYTAVDPPEILAASSTRFGLGYQLMGPDDAMHNKFGHSGYGGSHGYVDVNRKLALGLTKNRTDTPKSALEILWPIVLVWADEHGK